MSNEFVINTELDVCELIGISEDYNNNFVDLERHIYDSDNKKIIGIVISRNVYKSSNLIRGIKTHYLLTVDQWVKMKSDFYIGELLEVCYKFNDFSLKKLNEDKYQFVFIPKDEEPRTIIVNKEERDYILNSIID
ncbi:hypothetical protein [Bacillus coahuilensis]|uniref:hypothetical protein n=1 Tax=Bacillus coahuilensis TaxID=408580 RepID=UPI00018512FF|nr:hypothetical protein [Bacillus coahuilensis]